MDETKRRLKAIWVAWEKLRILYNVVLLVEGLLWLVVLLMLANRANHPEVNLQGPWISGAILCFGVAANVFYCLGPLIESGIFLVRGSSRLRTRRILFFAGLLFSMYFIWGSGMRGWSHIAGYLR